MNRKIRTDQRQQRVKTHRKLWATIIFVLVFIIGGGLFWGVRTWQAARNAMQTSYQSAGNVKLRNVNTVLKKKQPFSVLLLGTDTGALGRSGQNFTARTDTIIVATVNPKKQRVTLTSIPRDTQVVINGQNEKINAAYTLGGAGGAIKSVQKLLNIPIDFYALINMGGLKQMVNALGGVTLTPKMTFKYGHANVKKGVEVTLNGAEALDYARMRYDDPLGDYGRQKRQRQVIMAMTNQMGSLGSILNVEKIVKQMAHNMRTDLTFDDMVTLYLKYKNTSHHIKTDTLKGTDATIDNLSYQLAEPKERYRVSKKLRQTLGLSTNNLTVDRFTTPATMTTK